MKIVGYADRLSVQPGETIRFMVSTELPNYRADIVRLIHGDENPIGPGFKEVLLSTPANGDYNGKKEDFPRGSYALITNNRQLDQIRSLTIQAWIYATTPNKGEQGVITQYDCRLKTGFGIFIDQKGELVFRVGGPRGEKSVSSGRPLRGSTWYFVAATYDANTGRAVLYQIPSTRWPLVDTQSMKEQIIETEFFKLAKTDLTFAAYCQTTAQGETEVLGHFNGKIDAPCIFARALDQSEIDCLARGASPVAIRDSLLASWDFSKDIRSVSIRDTSGNSLDGYLVNYPKRAVTGHNWTGNIHNYDLDATEYGAIHFHDDDLEDACWKVDFELNVPKGMKSGVYAARLRGKGNESQEEDYVPFFVRPRRGEASSRVALLIPTLSYLAYGNEHTMSYQDVRDALGLGGEYPKTPQDKYIIQNKLLSLYDRHSDGSGVCYVSRLRPILNMRPKYNAPFLGINGKGSPHQFNADLNIIDWLEALGHDYDIITDEDLHFEGASLLKNYKVLMTGSHPEYWTWQMVKGVESYLEQGGRLMYLGGNGMYWVTAIDSERPHNFEVRRWGGGGTWESQPGEYYLSTTGELGGKWRTRGIPPQRLLGTGFAAQGFDRGRPYKRREGSFDPRASFIFEGVGHDELIGDFDSLALDYGAAGDEVDRVDFDLGTPPHTLILATASGFSDSYQHAIEENLVSDSRQGGTVNPFVKGDMVYFECPKGGAVFSVSSISWRGCLSYNKYKNNVSKITDNVLKRFKS